MVYLLSGAQGSPSSWAGCWQSLSPWPVGPRWCHWSTKQDKWLLLKSNLGGILWTVQSFLSKYVLKLTFLSLAVQLSMQSITGRLVVILAHTYSTKTGREKDIISRKIYILLRFYMSHFIMAQQQKTIKCWRTDLLCSLFGAQISLILVGRWRLRAAGWLVQEFPQALGIISHWAVVVPKCWTVARRRRLWTSYKGHQLIIISEGFHSTVRYTDIYICGISTTLTYFT